MMRAFCYSCTEAEGGLPRTPAGKRPAQASPMLSTAQCLARAGTALQLAAAEILPENTDLDPRVLAAAAAAALVALAVCLRYACWGTRRAAQRGSYKAQSFARRQLSTLRAQSKQFPPPFPNGWYHVCDSDQLVAGRSAA